MSTKELIKCLTITICLLSSISCVAIVKETINVIDICKTHLLEHSEEMSTRVDHLVFKENKGDGKQIVIIDAGHGGHDPGTHGRHSKEKDIALQIALKLGEVIKSTSPNVRVIFTRTTDVFIPLHKRIGLANKKKADLFVSIHCNYVSNPSICGTETYVMGLHRAEDNLNIAKRENSVILLESEYETNYDGYDPNSPVGHILLSMIQNVFLDNSIRLASKVEHNFTNRNKTKSRGVKQAGFAVLREATMPSILIETGFLSNQKEEKYLISKNGQLEMATGISKGILSYFSIQNSPTSYPSQNQQHVVDAQKTKQQPNKNKGKYIVQVGVFSNQKDEKFDQVLALHGSLIKKKINDVYKYAIGYYSERKDADSICDRLRGEGFLDAFVVVLTHKNRL